MVVLQCFAVTFTPQNESRSLSQSLRLIERAYPSFQRRRATLVAILLWMIFRVAGVLFEAEGFSLEIVFHQLPDTKKPAINAGLFYSCIPRRTTQREINIRWSG